MARHTYLIAHTNDKGTNVAQAKITAITEVNARRRFQRWYPRRIITSIGIKGQDEYSG